MIIEGILLRLGEILPNGDIISKDCEIIIPDDFKTKTNKMKKQLPKIAIKYSEENWPEIKKAVDYLRSKGLKIIKRKDDSQVKGGYAKSLILDSAWGYFDAEYSTFKSFNDTDTILTMPDDFEKLKSYFEEPKRGEVWIVKGAFDWIVRIKENKKVFSALTLSDGYVDIRSDSFFSSGQIFKRKATPEEEAELIKAEHDNGFHWDGKEFIKIHEYVEVVKCVNPKHWYKNHIGDVFKVFGVSKFVDGWSFKTTELGRKGIIIECCKPSTKEAYEAQHGESTVSKLIKDGFDVNKSFFGLKSSDNFFNEIKEFSNELLSTIGNINGHNGIPNCRCCLIPEQHKTPSEAINSPKRLAKQVEKLESRVIDLKEENKRLKAQLQTIAQQPEIIEQVKKMITE